MGKLNLPKAVCVVLMFCAATAIASPAQIMTTLYNFCSQSGCTDGGKPYYAALVQAKDGNFYGTTYLGGTNNGGTVFKITSNGTLTTLYNLCSQTNCADGDAPYAGLIQASDGNFYGTTASGGSNGFGTVFQITPGGKLTTMHSFNNADGLYPRAKLVQAKDGNFYGTTYEGGASGYGTIFKISPQPPYTLTTLYSFDGAHGSSPLSELIQASDGNFYGTTNGGGPTGQGTVFKITPSGSLTTLYGFCSKGSCADGAYPYAGLVQASDGNLYGTTYAGGAPNLGTVFKITLAGQLTTLYSFCSQTNCADGRAPLAGLVQANDGNFYGTTYTGGLESEGTAFKITPAGQLTTVYTFCSLTNCGDGTYPYAGLVQGTDGYLYGVTFGGGADNEGTVFRLVPRVQFVSVSPCRLVDTRMVNGGSGPIKGGTFQTFNLPQLAQQRGCNSLSAPAAYSLNVTVVPQGQLGYLTVWPTGQNQPTISTLNSEGRVKANAAIVPAGVGAAINVYVSNTTDVVLDIDGYFASASPSTLEFYPLPPCRVADTRNTNGPLAGPYLSGGVPRDFPILESTCFPQGINPAAYSFNMTAVPKNGQLLGYLTVWPAGSNQPVVSTLNSYTGTVVANAAIVPAGTGGDIEAYASNDSDLVIDVNGYFAAPGKNGLSLYPVVPCRVLDTRRVGSGQPFVGDLTVNVVGSACAPPATAQAYVFNATIVPSGLLYYLTLWPDGGEQPYVSTLNAVDGAITSNMAIVPNSDGQTDVYVTNLTQLIVDIASYFGP